MPEAVVYPFKTMYADLSEVGYVLNAIVTVKISKSDHECKWRILLLNALPFSISLVAPGILIPGINTRALKTWRNFLSSSNKAVSEPL